MTTRDVLMTVLCAILSVFATASVVIMAAAVVRVFGPCDPWVTPAAVVGAVVALPLGLMWACETALALCYVDC